MNSEKKALLDMRAEGTTLVLLLSGDWLLRLDRPIFDSVEAALNESSISSLQLEGAQIGEWDTALLLFVRKCHNVVIDRKLRFIASDLPDGVQQMVDLSLAVPEAKATPAEEQSNWFAHIGESTLAAFAGFGRYCDFIGRLCLDIFSFLRGGSQLRKRDFLALLQATGSQALGIVSLLSFLMGLIVAFVGVVQLQKFGADIYVADLVGIAMTRELAAVMLGVIMAGRTGAAFAAQIGSMRVNEEVDALTCFGISPMQFLVLPRVFALILMMPLLCVCADVVSILGGMVVAVGISDVTVIQYMNQIQNAVALNDFWVGIFKSVVFGIIVAVAGCYRGLHCGKDASAVGLAATSAVVTGITWLVIADAIFAVAFQIIGI
ncbi:MULTISPECIES: ABC transporter permease [unclassified Lentimonas]|uniref:MlaE family ABC transporter permease n=1 Tax=unclassified Lentimonas TaxID=2630993 RepID=UPI001FD5BDD7|nr:MULTISPECIES: ABC transporter permease [unclassified Lentimonas]